MTFSCHMSYLLIIIHDVLLDLGRVHPGHEVLHVPVGRPDIKTMEQFQTKATAAQTVATGSLIYFHILFIYLFI